MAVHLLCNTVGHVATSAGVEFGSLVSGYDGLDAISGPRSKTVRGAAGSVSHRYQLNCPSTEVTHVVVARMDLFKNTLDADEVLVEYGSGHTTDSTTLVEDLALIGPARQDWVKAITRTSTAFSLLFNSTATIREFEYGKVYFSKAFSFGVEPDFERNPPKLNRNHGERVRRVQPAMGYKPYWVEDEFSLSFEDVELGKLLEFEALPLHSPLFVYDDTGDVIAHQLEHAIIAQPWSWTRVSDDAFNIDLNFSRLAHYE